MNHLVTANKKLNSELLTARNVSQNHQNRIIDLEKQQSKSEQYSRCSNVEISVISNEVSDQNLEQIIIGICKDSKIEVNPLDTEGCHRLPLERNATSTTKQVIVKFVNRKLSKAMLQHKKDINQKSKVFVSHSLCHYYRFFVGKVQKSAEKFVLTKFLGAVVTVRITKNSPIIKILHEKDLLV